MLAGVGATLLLATPGRALEVYGGLRGVPGAGGCVRDVSRQDPSDGRCPGAARGLQGAGALAVSSDGHDLYLAAPDSSAVVTFARRRGDGALRSPSQRACVQAARHGSCNDIDPALGGVDAVTLSADGRFLYAGAQDSAAVSVLRRSPDGLLHALRPTIAAVGAGAGGGPLRASGASFGCVAGHVLAGLPAPGCAARDSALNAVSAIALSPDGRDLYAVSYGAAAGQDSIVALARDGRSGGLEPLRGRGSCIQSRPRGNCSASAAGLVGAAAVTVSSDGRFVYVASQISGAVVAFARHRGSGRLAALTGRGSCVSATALAPPGADRACSLTAYGLAGARALALSPDGRELYVAAFDPGALVTLARDPRSGRLAAPGGPEPCLQAVPVPGCPTALPVLHGASSLALSSDGRALFLTAEGADSLIEFLRDPRSGALRLATLHPATVSTISGVGTLALPAHSRDLYVASPFDDAVAELRGA